MKKMTLLQLLIANAVMAIFFGCATMPEVKQTSEEVEQPGTITDITVQDNLLSIAGDREFVYTMYTGNDPYKVTIDIPDMTVGNFSDKIVPEKNGITEVIPRQVASPNPSVQIDIILQAPSSVVPEYSDNTLTVNIKPQTPVLLTEMKEMESPGPGPGLQEPTAGEIAPDEAAEDETASVDQKAADITGPDRAVPLPPATEVESIEFQKSLDTVKVLIRGNGAMMPNIFPLAEKIVVDLPGVSLNASLPTGSVPPVKGIRAGKHQDKLRLVLDLMEETQYDVAAVGNTIEIALKKEGTPVSTPAAQERAVSAETATEAVEKTVPAEITEVPETGAPVAGKYTGKRISLDFQDAEIGPIFRLLADVNGYNLVLDPAVKGRITIKLMNVPWDQALDIILNTFNLSKSIEGNILWIAPTNVFAKMAEEKSRVKDIEEKAEDLVQEIVRVNYASAADLSSAITTGKLLSPRGSITIDSRMNTLIIKDTAGSIEKVKELVKIMDVSKPQVMIEAKLVQVSDDYREALGIRWGGSFATQTFPNTVGGNFSVNTPTQVAGPTVDNPGGTLDMTLGYANSLKVSLSLSALETINKAKTLSNPKILTMDNEAATIQQGSTFYIETVSQSGTQTEERTATLSLTVTPKITPDGYVQLKVNATDNSLVSVTPPVVDTKSLTTQALVKNGETLVLGGIYTTSKSEGEEGLPLLSRLPVLGWLFKTKTQTGPNVRELLIFITPTIVSKPL
jgi:type IV pilus assembly protein PilQ